MNPNGPDEILE